MKLKKAKEQLIAISLLLSVFIFFIYLKMNPEINNDNQNISSINNQVNEIVEKMYTDSVENIQLAEDSISSEQKSDTVISFTERELKRAKSYIDKDWKPDDTINMAAWDFVSKNPTINEIQTQEFEELILLESNQVVNAK
tara:strand:+ start:10082 stop:10501 length:420 start_codon:yes stop_codon:yes gene_type:complete